MKWKRTATGILSVAALAATALVVSGSAPTTATADAAVGPSRRPLPSGSPAPDYLVSAGTGGVLHTEAMQTLYYNDQDTSASIVCVDTCATVWKPFILPQGTPLTWSPEITLPLATAARPDGSLQVTYAGHPLYTYTVDSPGHTTGDGDIDAFIGQAYSWHAATASGLPMSTPSGVPSPAEPGQPTGVPSGPPSLPPLAPAPTVGA